MADVFISYERGSEARAQQVVGQLEAAGFDVWIDADLPTHRAYTDVIDEQLHAAKAVLVLWTAAAAQRDWVRAEADYAREQRKLVQASLDGSLPPLPFNQIRSGDLAHWRGDPADPHWRKVVESIAALAGSPQPLPAGLAHEPIRARPRAGAWLWAIAAAAVLLLAAVSLWVVFGRPHAEAGTATGVAVMPFQVESSSPDARFFADGVTDAIQSALSTNRIRVVSKTDAGALAGPGAEAAIARLGVRLILDGTAAGDGRTLAVSVHVNDAINHETLWSGQFTGAAERPDELKASVAADAVSVLHCSADAVGPHGLSDPQILMLYLQACDLYERAVSDPQADEELLETLRQVNARAPQFAPAFAMRAEQLAAVSQENGAQATARRTEARAAAERALAIDPTNARALAAQSLALPQNDWAGREAILHRAQLADPDSDWANAYLGLMLAEVGRIQEGADLVRKATAVNPLSLDHSADSARMSALAGRAQEASDEAAQVAKSWPDNEYARLRRLDVAAALHDWDGALVLLDSGRVGLTPTLTAAARSCVVASRTPTPSQRAKARADVLGMALQPGGLVFGPGGLQLAISCLSQLGFVDEAFSAAQSFQPLTTQGVEPGFLFAPDTANLRRDPRFMQLANRIGLVRYWRATGHWPDFCAEPNLPYDCKAQAARLATGGG